MRTTQPGAAAWLRLADQPEPAARATDHAGGLSPAVSSQWGGAVRTGDTWLDVVVPAPGLAVPGARPVSGGGWRASGPGRADGGAVGAASGRDAAGAPRFDQPVAPGAYLWWYIDAISDDGRNALSIIAFVGSVFSPYYAWALQRRPDTPAEDHCAINVALYGEQGRRWTMTERSRHSVKRSAGEFVVGPSRVSWDGQSLLLELDEVSVPIPQRVRGRIRVWPQALCQFSTPLDDGARHRWGPIAPSARIEVELDKPGARWSGHAYVDSNEGDEPIYRPFTEWDWSRSALKDGSTAVIYDVRQKTGSDRVIARHFKNDGSSVAFEAPARQTLPRTAWRLGRTMRSEAAHPARVEQTLEDTPFYVRSVLSSGLFGERVTSVHETLNVARVVSTPVRLMLPWRMPRLR
jgi:carotenoid 1,2-hydratase